MTTIVRLRKHKPESVTTGQHRHRFSREDFQRMARAGLFEGQRVELIEGDIIEMTPIGYGHASATDSLSELLRGVFGEGFRVRNQSPVALGAGKKPSDPQPDIAVVSGSWRDYAKRAPGPKDIQLIVEIAETSIAYDRDVKGALYAAAGIVEYWIVNLADSTLEVYREQADGAYAVAKIYKRKDKVAPIRRADGFIEVGDFLP